MRELQFVSPIDPAPVEVPRKVPDFAAAILEKHQGLVLAGFSAVFLSICVLISATKLIWYDELCAYLPAKLPFPAMLQFFRQGLDAHTPASSIAIYATMKLLGDNPVAVRLPNTIGYLVMCLCIYRFVARRCPAVYALAAMIFAAASGAFYHATEARGYGIVVGFAGLALVCWQDAADNRLRSITVPGLFLSLAAALCCHYFAVFLWIPFGLAELTRTYLKKRIDVPVWLALLVSPSVILIFLPAMRLARAAYLPGIWAKPSLGQGVNAYFTMLDNAFAPVLLGAALYFLLASKYSRPEPNVRRVPVADRVLALTLALAPVIVVPLSFLIGTYVPRYTLYSVAGITIFLAFAMYTGLRGDRLAPLVVSVALLAGFASKSAITIGRQMSRNGGIRTPLGQPFQNSPWMRAVEGTSLPVMVTPAVFFLQFDHYAPASVQPRVLYAADHSLALRFENTDSGETNLLRFSRMLPIAVRSFKDFLAANPHFLLAADTTDPTWHIPALLAYGAQLRLLNRTGTYLVFDVTVGNGGAQAGVLREGGFDFFPFAPQWTE